MTFSQIGHTKPSSLIPSSPGGLRDLSLKLSKRRKVGGREERLSVGDLSLFLCLRL